MFIRFSLENFLSFRERQTLDMMAVRTCKERLGENTFQFDKKDRLLRAAALYGANASGKSNLFNAMRFCVSFIRESAFDRAASDDIATVPFLFDEESMGRPTSFELEFSIEGVWYRYGFSVTSKSVESEWLYAREKGATSIKARFVRKREAGDDKIEVHPSFEGADALIVEKTRENALFLSTCAGFAVVEAETILREISSWMFVAASRTRIQATAHMIDIGECRNDVLRFVNLADPSIDDIEVEKVDFDSLNAGPDGRPLKRMKYRVIMQHKLKDKHVVPLPLELLGSLGTQKAFELAGPIFKALSSGAFLFIDELDSRLHPILTREIIKLFNDSGTNPKNAQLVFNTHDTNLLNCKVYSAERDKKEQLLRRDQIYFVERTGEFVSRMYSLVDFKYEDGSSVRNDASVGKEYLAGEYGAIPFIGDFCFKGEPNE